jgi:predicted SAM-dependent methyltransferase
MNQYSRFADDLPSPENEPVLIKYKVIAGYGTNILCPFCLSTARERLVIAMLSTTNVQNKKVLHLSPERNVFRFLSKQSEVTTSDITPAFYKNIDKNILSQDATKLSFRDNSFDMVIANHVLEHIPHDKQAIDEFFRVLKPNGLAILQVPYSETLADTIEEIDITDPHLRSLKFGQRDHVRIYSLKNYVQRLGDAGFNVNVISYDEMQHLYIYGIQKNESFFEITKPITS